MTLRVRPSGPLRRLVWILPHPTPYNTYLLNGLADRLPTQTEAVFRWETMASHPWTRLPARRFSWRVSRQPGGRDKELESLAANNTSSLVVFAGWRNRTMFPPLLARLRNGLPYAFWTDTPKAGTGLRRSVNNAAYCFFARRAVTTLATGTPAIERYRVMGLPEDKLDSFPFVVDPDHFSPQSVEGAVRDGACNRFIVCGRLLTKIKGQSVALEALAKAIKESRRPLELIIAGTGPDEPLLRQEAVRLGIANAVHFIGWVEYDQLPTVLKQCAALVMPSYWDPYPVAVLEAMASGLPVLGSLACGSVRERVVHGESGLIHEPGAAAALAEHMCWIATNREQAERMGLKSLAVSKSWGIEAATAVVHRVIEKANRR